MPKTVGFVGLGRMGSGMAANLAGAVDDLLVHDLDPRAVQRLCERGARAASPSQMVGEASLVFLCLPDAEQVSDLLFAANGLAANAPAELTVVDCTTMHHASARELANRCKQAGIEYCDCPVSGMPFRAQDGTLTIMFGGPESVYASTRALLDAMGSSIIHCGEVGMGQVAKSINNIVYNVNIAAICEVMPLALRAGLTPAIVEELLTTGSSRSFASEYFVPRILARAFDKDFSMRAAYKDILNVQDLATTHQASVPVVSAMIAVYQQAMADGHGEEPKSAMIKVYEKVLGLQVSR